MSEDYEVGKFVLTEQSANAFTLKNANQLLGTLREAEDGRLEFSGDVHESAKVFFEHVVAYHSEALTNLRAEIDELRKVQS
jgi:hypothetical protein